MAKIADVQEVSLEKLRPYERNAKKHGAGQIEKLKASIMEFGFLTPCLIDSDYNLIAGHGRVMAAKELGIGSVPCVFIEGLSDEQRRAYILADNRLGELGEWDIDLVVGELIELDELGFEVELTGFDMPEELPEVIEDDFDESVVLDEPRTKLGDIWQLGDHRLICGDSTSADVFEKLLNGNKADICITSPPYNAGHMDVNLSAERGGGVQKGTQKKYINDDDTQTDEDYANFLFANIDLLLINADEVFYNIGVGAGSKKAIAQILYNYQDQFKELMYWKKDNPMPVIVESVISSAVELIICLGSNGSRSFNSFNDRMFHGGVEGMSASATNKYADVHKATFPVYFPSEIISRFTKNNGTVLDCFGGTGTTMIACEQLKRKCFMIELEPVYCDIIIDRWEQFTGKEAVLIDG